MHSWKLRTKFWWTYVTMSHMETCRTQWSMWVLRQIQFQRINCKMACSHTQNLWSHPLLFCRTCKTKSKTSDNCKNDHWNICQQQKRTDKLTLLLVCRKRNCGRRGKALLICSRSSLPGKNTATYTLSIIKMTSTKTVLKILLCVTPWHTFFSVINALEASNLSFTK